MTIVSMLIGPTLVNRVGAVRAVVLFQVLSLPFLLLTGFTNVLLIASVGFLFRQALMNAANPIQSSILIDRVPDHRRGIANSVTQTAFMLGWATMGPVQSNSSPLTAAIGGMRSHFALPERFMLYLRFYTTECSVSARAAVSPPPIPPLLSSLNPQRFHMERNSSIGYSNGPGLETSLIPEDRPQYRIAHLNGYPVSLIPVIIPFVYIGCSGEPPGKSKLQEPLIKSLLPD